jgi:hypothetical protein
MVQELPALLHHAQPRLHENGNIIRVTRVTEFPMLIKLKTVLSYRLHLYSISLTYQNIIFKLLPNLQLALYKMNIKRF